MKMKYIAKKVEKGVDMYLTPRRPTGRMYEDRVSWSKSIDDAKIFMQRGAATNSARQSGADDFEVIPVRIVLAAYDAGLNPIKGDK
jgi:hypothetical protein